MKELLTYILEKEKIDITEAEIDEKLEERAKSAKKTVKELKATMNENSMNYLKNDILMNKLLNFLMEKNLKKSK